jgi:hypothetical protein
MKAFGISKKLVDSARQHAIDHGAGMIVPDYPIFRMKCDPISFETFIDFILSENYLQDVALGTLNVKINSSYSKSIPKVIRLASHSK